MHFQQLSLVFSHLGPKLRLLVGSASAFGRLSRSFILYSSLLLLSLPPTYSLFSLLSFQVFVSPLILAVLAFHPPLQPSAHTFVLTSLLAFAVSLILLCQPSPPAALFLGIISPAAQALFLVFLKTWLLSFPDRGPMAALANAAPFALIAIALPAVAHSAQRSVRGLGSLGVMPRLTVGTSTWLLLFVSLRTAERLLEALAVSRLRSPVAVTLLSPARNLISLLLSPIIHIYVGLASGRAALIFVYSLTLLGLWAAEPDVGSVIGLQSPSATPSFVLCTPNQDHNLDQHHHHHPCPKHEAESDQPLLSSRTLSSTWSRTLRLVSFGPLIVLLLLRILDSSTGLDSSSSARRAVSPGRAPGSVDIVVSYYNEPLDNLSSVINYVRSVLPIAIQHPRVVIYVKGEQADLGKILSKSGADEVISLPNVGREGGTYLTHILRQYNSSLSILNQNIIQNENDHDIKVNKSVLGSPEVWGLADHTIFMQPDISWHWIAKPRMELFDYTRTGFLSFGPYLNSICGKDGLGNGYYDRMRDIYVMFYETFCPPTGQLASYAGQFVVSKKRILRNSYTKYDKLKKILEAPLEHWIHSEGTWFKWKGSTDSNSPKRGPSSPFLGHALERSWPIIFGCDDPALAEICPDEVIDIEKCQCFD
ncbi:hypothetical protein CROQUDRAFT_500119 [Cronartium quercuum f. sp. fusiforme G11]|uniref:Uncharacterized protein n=1 Tax=Cronartium quercuum f. sp. fusiforme G11 TaxID=708437 RepID=A0A9P6NIS3_9BASI|nr:hypothetical protein CROQUDRAFT_500119 [Cronartium quercuum f. sp. fusiforme G11]